MGNPATVRQINLAPELVDEIVSAGANCKVGSLFNDEASPMLTLH